ncbi:MAG: cyclic nucleotide-binding domain-containing protein [Dehalococcoidales bacterium]|nr:cyclic nucleotide-binding domain-containing protein [Dehalococcoidales bacterium]
MKNNHSLRGCPLFDGLADADLEKLATISVEKEHEAGSTLFKEGDFAEELLIIQEGKVAVQMAVQSPGATTPKKATVDIAQANDVLGWSAIIEPHVHTLTAVCLQNTRALAISGAKLRSMLQHDHTTGYTMVSGLARIMMERLNESRRLLVSERSWVP